MKRGSNSLTAATGMLTVLLSWGTSTAAESVQQLHNIGLHPFTGTPTEACQLHTSAHGLFSMAECLGAVAKSDDSSLCPASAVLQEGTTWWMLFTNDAGQHRIGQYQISFGAKVARTDPARMANDCSGVVNGFDMVKPHACGNYAVQVDSAPPAVTPRATPRAPAPAPAAPKRTAAPRSTPAPQLPQGIPSGSAMLQSGSVDRYAIPHVFSYCEPQ